MVRLDARSFTELSRMPLLPPDQNLMYDVLLENYVRIAPIGSESDPGDRFLSCETNAAESTCRLLPVRSFPETCIIITKSTFQKIETLNYERILCFRELID